MTRSFSVMGLMATSSKGEYAIPRSNAPRAPCPCSRPLLTHTSQGILKQSSVSVSVGSLVLVCTRFVWVLWVSLALVWGLILKTISPLLPSCWGFSFALGHGVSPQSHFSAVQPLLQCHKTGKTDSFRAGKNPCVHQDPGERISDPTRDWPRLASEWSGVSSGGMGWQWPAAGLGAQSASVHAWDLLKDVAIIFIQFSHSIMFDSLQPRGLQHARLTCPSPTPRACSKSCLLRQWCHPTISSSVTHFSCCTQSFLASGSFQMSQFFTSGGQSIGISVSASVLAMNTQDSFPLGWTGWISLLSKGLSRVFSNTTVQKHQLFVT